MTRVSQPVFRQFVSSHEPRIFHPTGFITINYPLDRCISEGEKYISRVMKGSINGSCLFVTFVWRVWMMCYMCCFEVLCVNNFCIKNYTYKIRCWNNFWNVNFKEERKYKIRILLIGYLIFRKFIWK